MAEGACDHSFDLVDGGYECIRCGAFFYATPVETGIALSFGIIGMAEAIYKHHPCSCGWHDWRWIPGRNDDVCDRCGISGDEFDGRASDSPSNGENT